MSDIGMVYLVGSGPGDPGLITVRGVECLERADVVVYDRLAGRGFRRYAPTAEWINVGKQPDHHPVPQPEINRLLVDLALTGKIVVRLKGGDPFVFGRGGEEALALVEAGVSFEIVPGVTSAIAVPAYAGIPVTQRGVAAGFTVLTGHRAPGGGIAAAGTGAPADAAETRVYLMGVEGLPQIVAGLLEQGVPPQTPAAVIACGATPFQQVVTASLDEIVTKAAGVSPPAVTVIGDVVRCREALRWFDLPQRRPLLGLRVLNTRPLEGGSHAALSASLERLGVAVVALPAFQIAPPADPTGLDAAIERLASAPSAAPAFDWILFTSVNAVRYFMLRCNEKGHDSRILAGVWVGVIGAATAAALGSCGLRADFMPSRSTGAGLAAELETQAGGAEGKRILLPQSASALPDLAASLATNGAEVTAVTAYSPAPVLPNPLELEELLSERVDVALFFSPSALSGVRAMLAAAAGEVQADKILKNLACACIGPTTADAARQCGMQVVATAAEPSEESLLEALIQWRTWSTPH